MRFGYWKKGQKLMTLLYMYTVHVCYQMSIFHSSCPTVQPLTARVSTCRSCMGLWTIEGLDIKTVDNTIVHVWTMIWYFTDIPINPHGLLISIDNQ